MCITAEIKKPIKMPIKCPICQARLCDAIFDTAALSMVSELGDISQGRKSNIFIKCRKCNKEVIIEI